MRLAARPIMIAFLILAGCSAESPAANQASSQSVQVDPDSDVWQASLDDTRAGQVCSIKAQDLPPGQHIEFDFYTESEEGTTDVFVVAPSITTTAKTGDVVLATISLSNGAVYRDIASGIEMNPQVPGAARLGQAFFAVNDGIAFYRNLMESEYLNYSNDRGDKFHIGLVGRNDLVQELRDCLGRTDGARAGAAAAGNKPVADDPATDTFVENADFTAEERRENARHHAAIDRILSSKELCANLSYEEMRHHLPYTRSNREAAQLAKCGQ